MQRTGFFVAMSRCVPISVCHNKRRSCECEGFQHISPGAEMTQFMRIHEKQVWDMTCNDKYQEIQGKSQTCFSCQWRLYRKKSGNKDPCNDHDNRCDDR